MLLIPAWLSKLLSTDVYLLKFSAGSSVPKHKDPVREGFKHYRMNITICGAGKMFINGPIKRFGRVEIFRSGQYEHGLDTISEQMYMPSFGTLVKG